ncbi:hypothetical protein [Bosea sp. Tri-44]|uniref:hypothetical protein n=1 Tax=Bosea sp. Tri-44 TaxID=1972137 RepID=UPI00100E8826|nr:hypothetical protein [Bosea sp. Tri-44]
MAIFIVYSPGMIPVSLAWFFCDWHGDGFGESRLSPTPQWGSVPVPLAKARVQRRKRENVSRQVGPG